MAVILIDSTLHEYEVQVLRHSTLLYKCRTSQYPLDMSTLAKQMEHYIG